MIQHQFCCPNTWLQYFESLRYHSQLAIWNCIIMTNYTVERILSISPILTVVWWTEYWLVWLLVEKAGCSIYGHLITPPPPLAITSCISPEHVKEILHKTQFAANDPNPEVNSPSRGPGSGKIRTSCFLPRTLSLGSAEQKLKKMSHYVAVVYWWYCGGKMV